MNKEPETYEELIRQKRCIDLAKYYENKKMSLAVCQIHDFELYKEHLRKQTMLYE